MLSVQNYNLTSGRSLAFKSHENDEKNQVKPQAAKTYQTHAGLKTGAVWGGIDVAVLLGINSVIKNLTKIGQEAMNEAGDAIDKTSRKNLDEAMKTMKAATKNIWISIPVSLLVALGCGALVDKKINDKHVKMADKLQTEGKNAVLENEDRADITKNGSVFYKSNVGKTFGVALGAIVLPIVSLISGKIAKAPITVKSLVSSAVTGSIGGLILGSITDKVSNKGAAKFADKQNAEV